MCDNYYDKDTPAVLMGVLELNGSKYCALSCVTKPKANRAVGFLRLQKIVKKWNRIKRMLLRLSYLALHLNPFNALLNYIVEVR